MITITINGVDRTGSIAFNGSFRIQDNINQQRDTLSFEVRKGQESYWYPEKADEIIVTDGENRIFGGVITSIERTIESVNLAIFSCEAVDWSFVLDRKLVLERYSNKTISEIIEDLLSKYAPTFTMDSVIGDYTVTAISFNSIKISECLEKMAQLTGYSWYVDYEKDVHFFPKNQEEAPISLTDTSGNYVWESLKVTDDFSQIKNSIFIKGGDIEGNEVTEAFTQIGTDNERKFCRTAHKFAHLPTVKINGGPDLNGGVEYINDDADYDFMWDFNQKYIRFTNSGDINAPIEINEIPIIKNDPNLKAYYRFESGALTTDSSGNSHTLTAISDPAETTGKFGGGVDFDSNDAYSIVNHADLRPTTFTVGAWIKTTTTINHKEIISSWNETATVFSGWLFRVKPAGKLEFFMAKNTGKTASDYVSKVSVGGVGDGNWHFVVATVTGTNIKLYIDGVEDAGTTSGTGSLAYNATNYPMIGCRQSPSGNFEFLLGQLDDLFLLNGTVLTALQISKIFSGSINSKFPDVNDVVTVTGIPLYKLIGRINNSASIKEYGIYEFKIEDQNLKSQEDMFTRAQTELNAYKNGVIEGEFQTYESGLRSGQVININSPLRGVNEDFLIQSVSYSAITPDGAGIYNVRLATLKTVGIIEFLQRILRNNGVSDGDDDLLISLLQYEDDVTVDDTLSSITTSSPPYVIDSYPSTQSNPARMNFSTIS